MRLRRKPGKGEYLDPKGRIRTHKKQVNRKIAEARAAARKKYLEKGTLSYTDFVERGNNFMHFFNPKHGTNSGLNIKELCKKKAIKFADIEGEHQTVFKGLGELIFETLEKSRIRGKLCSIEKWRPEMQQKWFDEVLPRMYNAYKILREKGLSNEELKLSYWE